MITLGTAAIYLIAGSWVFRRLVWRLDTMADADFPSDFEREIHRHERAVDEHRRRQELEAEVERLKSQLAWYRGRAERAEYIVVGLASTLSRYSGFPQDSLIQAHAPENARPTSIANGG